MGAYKRSAPNKGEYSMQCPVPLKANYTQIVMSYIYKYLEDTCPLLISQSTMAAAVYDSGKLRNLYLRFMRVQPKAGSRNLDHMALAISPTSS